MTAAENFPAYLRRVGEDYAESGRDATAEDYQQAARRIEVADINLRILAELLPDGLLPDARHQVLEAIGHIREGLTTR